MDQFHLVVALEFFGDAFDFGVQLDHQVVRLLRIPVHICQILFERPFHSHNVDYRGAVLFQIVVMALYADAGDKFIFNVANTSLQPHCTADDSGIRMCGKIL